MTKILSIVSGESTTLLANRLPYEVRVGKAATLIAEEWPRCDAMVVFLAIGALVRIIAPLLSGKYDDPAIICVDSHGNFVVPVLGGHSRGANDIAREVAKRLGATAVITTATDHDSKSTMEPHEYIALHPEHAVLPPHGKERHLITEEPPCGMDNPNKATASDRLLTIGVGLSTPCKPEDLHHLVSSVIRDKELTADSIESISTIVTRMYHPAMEYLSSQYPGIPVRTYTAEELSMIDTPNPSHAVKQAVGTPSVAEAAALAAGGPGAELVVEKQVGNQATVAIAKRIRKRGSLSIVGIGPGDVMYRTPAATEAIESAGLVIGYEPYIDLCSPLLGRSQQVERSPIGAEMARAERAVRSAAGGINVALVCSGDPGIYAMASPVFQVLDTIHDDPWVQDMDIRVIPGVSAAQAAAALLGAPLGHDHAYISLSDLLTPWEVIEKRLIAAASAGLAIAIYNPTSSKRPMNLAMARDILLKVLPAGTPVGIVDQAARKGEKYSVITLGELDDDCCTMTTCLLIGSPQTITHGNTMYAPRGYQRMQLGG